MPSGKRRKAWATMVLTAGLVLAAQGPERAAGAPVNGRTVQPVNRHLAVGMVEVRGQVWVGGEAAPGATAVYEGDTVRTGRDGNAVMRLRSGMTVAMGGDGEVELGGAGREVQVKQGAVEIEGGGKRVRLVAGQVAQMEKIQPPHRAAAGRSPLPGGRPPQAARQAGTVSGEIPKANIMEREGQKTNLPLNLHDAVNWKDLVETENTGRVRIQLLDGSVLNVGARSQMQIIEHNPQTQQTEVELTLGRVRSRVMKLTKPGARFQMKTQTAVIGVVGTIFVVEATPSSTRVMCIEGRVTVQNINPAVQGRVQLGPGQSTVVGAGLSPTAAAATSTTELQTAVERTTIREGARSVTNATQAPTTGGTTGGITAAGTTAAGTAGGTAAGAGVAGGAGTGASSLGTGLTVTTVTAAAVGAGSAVAGVTALSQANNATSALNQSTAALQNATNAANAATAAINSQPTVSPSTPCGCGP